MRSVLRPVSRRRLRRVKKYNQQVNTDKQGHFRIRKTYITDPDRNTLYIHVCFDVLAGTLQDYDLHLYVNPILTNSASDDIAHIENSGGRKYLVASDTHTAMAIGSSIPFSKTTVGYIGQTAHLEGLVMEQRDMADGDRYDDGGNGSAHLLQSISEPGDVVLLGQLDLTGGGSEASQITFTIAIGFGSTEKAAICACEGTLQQTFDDVMCRYQRGWQTYIRTLDRPQSWVPLKQYYAAAMVIKAHEDKLHPGAIVASLSVPWGDNVAALDSGTGGYHLVWPRDLYHSATGLAAVGDRATAKRALAYLADTLQKPDGSFPQNAWVDGAPYWNGIQLDEVAFPILLADYLGETNCYESLVKPAAQYLVQHGPFTPQERWEKNEGLSASTMAAEIAALVVATKMAVRHGDYVSATVYLAAADKWFLGLDEWLADELALRMHASRSKTVPSLLT